MLCAWGARCSARRTRRPQRRARSEATFRSLWAATFAMALTPWQVPKRRLNYGSTTMRCSPGRITRMLGCTSDCKCLARQDRMQVQTRSSLCAMPAAVYIEACASMGRVLYGLCGVRIAQEKPQCARGSGNYLIQRCDAGQRYEPALSLSLHSQTFPQTTNPGRKTGAPPIGFLPRAFALKAFGLLRAR